MPSTEQWLCTLSHSIFEPDFGEAISEGRQKLDEVVREWNQIWNASRPVLRIDDDGRRMQITDTRPCARLKNWRAEELETEIYHLCDSAQTPAALLKQLSMQRGAEVTMQEVEPALERLCRANVLLRLNGKLLGVGVNFRQSS